MGGKRVTIENVFKIEPYRSIINLLNEFQSHKDGISQRHMRYALIPNHDKDNLHKNTIADMKGFFGDKLQLLVNEGYIKTDCITSRNRLTNVLDTLVHDLCIVKKGTLKWSKGKKIRYILHPWYRIEIERRINKDNFDEYPVGSVTNIPQGDMTTRYHTFYGINPDSISRWNTEEQQTLLDSMNSISELISKINMIKNKYTFADFVKLMRKASVEFEGSKEFIKAFSDNNFLRIFCNLFMYKFGNHKAYFISLHDLIGKQEISDIEAEIQSEKLQNYHSDFGKHMYDSLLFEEYGLDSDELWEFDNIAMSVINSLDNTREISYSCYHKISIAIENEKGEIELIPLDE